jgi:3-hydroxyacyl-CoA dehydrogenase
MREPVRIEREGEIGVIVVDNPPVNALAHPVRLGLLAAIERLDEESSARAIVLHGAGRDFMAGADLRELDAPPQPPLLKDVLLRLEASNKPVIAALHGYVLGGGAETALASHYRCASADLQLGFPEVKLGLLPGAGGTVRLPRVVGVKAALDLLTSGASLGLEGALALGLVDLVMAEDPRAGAVEYAKNLLAGGVSPRRLRDRAIADAGSATAAFFRDYRSALPRTARRSRAIERLLQSIEAAVRQPFEPALDLAQRLFQECRTSTESRSLRHLFRSERASRLARDPTAALKAARAVDSVGVVGAGTMGSGIAASFAQAGFTVTLVDVDPQALQAGLGRAHSLIESAVRKGRIGREEGRRVRARLRSASALEALSQADLIIEAVFESLPTKEAVFEQLGRLAKPGAVLATNTSTLDVSAIARASGRAADVVGMHFFSPAHLMRLVEIVRTTESSPASLATAAAVTQRLGKLGVIVGNAFGFVGNRMLYAYGREKELMLLEGATPEQVDLALEEFGMAMGPNAVGDLAGLDVGVAARRAWKDRPDDPRFYRVSELLVEHGRLGQKSGRGFYRYDGAERRRAPDPQVVALIRAEALRLGVPQREITSDEIVERCLLALINEGAHLLEDGIARSGGDIDVIWCNGYGFPRDIGGPMFHADQAGLPAILAAMEKYGELHGTRYWTPAPLLERLAHSGGSLAEYRRDESPGV